MRISILAGSAIAALALAPTAFMTSARAQTTVIKRDAPDVVIERRDAPTVVEKRTVESRGSTGCTSKTTKKTNEFGDTKTVSKESCD